MNNEFDIIKNHKVYDENKPFELLLEKEIQQLNSQMESLLLDYVYSIKPTLVDLNHDIE